MTETCASRGDEPYEDLPQSGDFTYAANFIIAGRCPIVSFGHGAKAC